MGNNLGSVALLAGATGIFAVTAPATGQGLLGGALVTYGLQSELRVVDNLGLDDPSPGVSTLWDNRFSFSFLSETPASQLRLDTGATLRTSDLPGQSLDVTFDEPFAMLGYTWNGANSLFETEASYREVGFSFANPLLQIEDDEFDETDLAIDTGSQITTDAAAVFEYGLNDPIGFGAELGYQGLQYAGTMDPSRNDSRTLSASAFTRFRFSPVAEGRLTVDWEDYEAEDADATGRQTYGMTAGLTYDIDPITLLEASLGYTHITETTNLPSSTTQSGLNGSVGLTRETRNGSAGLVLESDLNKNGRRRTLTASRMIELPTGSLDASLGLTRGTSGDMRPIGSIDFVYELPRGAISAALNHRVSTNTAGSDSASTSATLGYQADINRLSSFSFDANFAMVADLGSTPVERTTLTSLRATYSFELTPDWDLSAGYEHRIRTETGASRRASNEIFLLLERTLDARF